MRQRSYYAAHHADSRSDVSINTVTKLLSRAQGQACAEKNLRHYRAQAMVSPQRAR